jgi:hypothetical protein
MANLTRNEALERLEKLPCNYDGCFNTILPLREFDGFVTPSGKRVGRNSSPYICEWAYMAEHGVKKLIPVRAIITRQSNVSKTAIALKIKGKFPDHEPDYPYTYHHRGYYYLIDGNHRAVKATLLEQDYMWAYVADGRPYRS